MTDREKAERFESVTARAGYVIKELANEYGAAEVSNLLYESLWDYITFKFMGVAWDGEGSVYAGVESLLNDLLEDQTVMARVDATGAGIIWGVYDGNPCTQWFTPTTMAVLTEDADGNYRTVTIGYLYEEKLVYSQVGFNNFTLNSYWVADDQAYRITPIGLSTGKPLSNCYGNITRFRLRRILPIGSPYEAKYMIEAEYVYGYTLDGERHAAHGTTTKVTDVKFPGNDSYYRNIHIKFAKGDPGYTIGGYYWAVDSEGNPIGYPKIGTDIANVESVNGGNGSSAGAPNPTTSMLGHGGNGGNGGGGGGAPGYAKTEYFSDGQLVDLKIGAPGERVPGTGGQGSAGTAGYKGGCIIYY